MSATNAGCATAVESSSVSSDEMAAKAVRKRYEGLVMVRTKAIKGKGAWYWAHLEPILVNHSDTGLPKAVKLRCSLCDAVFSASNPSRTASEHLKRGTCPNFASAPTPISSMPPSSYSLSPPPHNHRKRGSDVIPPPPLVEPSRFSVTTTTTSSGGARGGDHHHHHHQLVLSGGKEDLGPLAMLEDSVKRLKSPKSSPAAAAALSKSQVDSAVESLADWVYECCGSVSFSSLEHPKFKAFLKQVGLPALSKRELAGSRLDARYEEAKAQSEAKILDATFFQITSNGWHDDLVRVAVNLPNGTTVFRRALFTNGYAHSKFAEEILWDTINQMCGSNLRQCAGIVSDRFRAKALTNLETQHPWMLNLSCQHRAFLTLINDLFKDLPLFTNVTANCFKLASFVNATSRIRHAFHKYQLQEYGHTAFLRLPFRTPQYTLVEDILSSARALHLLLSEESYKMLSMDEPVAARQVEEMMRNPQFWNELEAVHSLVKLIKAMAQDLEKEKPRIGQCLPLWEELRERVKEWCSKFHILEEPVKKVIDARFKKNYHPAWAAAFILDPLYLVKDSSGKYLPPFKWLSPDQEKDVDRLISRLVSREEAHIALMELMKWRTEGLDPVYAQAVQLKQKDPNTGKMRIANPQSSRLVWEAHLTEFKSLGKVAVRLIFLHGTALSDCSKVRWAGGARSHSRVGMDRAQKLMFISAHSKIDDGGDDDGGGGGGDDDDDDDDDKETELFALANGEDDVLNEVFVDTSSV